eukprot:Pgem_evm1s12466
MNTTTFILVCLCACFIGNVRGIRDVSGIIQYKYDDSLCLGPDSVAKTSKLSVFRCTTSLAKKFERTLAWDRESGRIHVGTTQYCLDAFEKKTGAL